MLRSSIYTASVVLLGTSAFAQGNLQSKVQPITSPVKDGGIYHVGTGMWTRAHDMSSIAQTTGAGIIYDNTCDTNYYSGTIQNEINIDDGRLPSTSSVVIADSHVPSVGNDSEVGSQNTYLVDGFEFAYCTNDQGPVVSYILNFYDAYAPCAVAPATPLTTLTLNGLPGSATAGVQACWLINFDLTATTASFTMQADGEGAYNAVEAQDDFGWSFKMNYAPFGPTTDGPLIAGSADATLATYLLVCSSSDGTVFDTGTVSPVYPANQDVGFVWVPGLGGYPNPPGEMGTGMGASNRFRSEGAAVADGCYFFGANLMGNFHLELWSNSVTVPTLNPMVAICDAGVGGVISCPCSNPPAGAPRGCDNSSATGGATIVASGAANLSADTLVFTTADEKPTATTIVLQGTAQVATGAIFGQGIRCVGGSLKRLYVHPAVGGSVTAPSGTDLPVSQRSAFLGDTITAGTHRFYMAYYRDPIVLGGCPPASTFNGTAGGDVLWN